MPSRCLLPFYYCSWGRRAALPPPPARFATRSLLHANSVTHDARSARHSQRKGAACGQRHGTAARGNSHALPKIPQALQRAESSKSRAQGTMSVGCTRPPPATPRRLCEVLQGRRSLRAMIQKRQKHENAGKETRDAGGHQREEISLVSFIILFNTDCHNRALAQFRALARSFGGTKPSTMSA